MKKYDHLDQWLLAANQKAKEKDYWLNKLSGEPVKSYFPYDYNPGDSRNTLADEPVIRITGARFDRQLLVRLLDICRGSDYTLHIILSALLMALLKKYTGHQDIIVGAPVYKQAVEGEFINTVLPLRTQLNDDITFKDLLFQVKQVITEAVEHQNFPIELLAKQLAIQGTPGSDDFSLFDTAILLENIHDKKRLQPLNLSMTFSFFRNDLDSGVLDLSVEYNFLRYRETTVQRIITHFQYMLSAVLADVDAKIANVEIISEEERKKLLAAFCYVEIDYPKDKTIHELFSEQVERTPAGIALVDPAKALAVSYSELDQRSDQLAQYLREQGVTEGAIVALLFPRKTDMIAAIMAVLKTGGAYLPIDPGYPPERIDYMLKDSGAKFLINKTPFEARISKYETNPNVQKINDQNKSIEDLTVLNLDHLNFEFVSNFGFRISDLNSSNLAYIIYTSGTTGKPKGVLIEHRNVVRLLFNQQFQFDFNNRDVWTLFHSYSFDFSVWEINGALLYGGCLLVIPRQVTLNPRQFLQIVNKHGVTVLNQTPSSFYNLIDEELKTEGSHLKLRYVIFGGEALKPGKLQEWYKKYPHTLLVNMFGITETTVHVTYKEIGQAEIEAGSSNIGKPIPTLSIYIMDRFQRLMPVGIAGELCVGGKGVARGYLNRPELTAEKFVQNPYKQEELLYKSGDLVRMLDNGDIEYLGRIDHQVQFHGFRIELGEIESHLLKHENVADVVALTTGEENEISLCAYIVPISPERFNAANLREYLAARLPEYMIPAYFVKLEKIPLTPNGKVDKKALPGPGIIFDQYIAPRNPLEKKLAELWAQALKLEKVGVKDNYFNIGGDSIKAIRLVSLINSELREPITIVDLYTNFTIETLAEKISLYSAITYRQNPDNIIAELESLKDRIMKEIQPAENIQDIYPMTDIEKGIAFYYLKHMGTGLYHDQFIYSMTYRDFDILRMKKTMAAMMEKHSILRTCFNMEDYEEHVQIVFKEIPLPVEYFDISAKKNFQQEKIIRECSLANRKNPFNVLKPPLWRMTFFSIDKDNILMLFEVHHAIMDGWSVASLLTEVHNIYLKLETDPAFVPEPLAAGYKDAVISEILEKQDTESIEFWKKELADYNRLNFFETLKSDVTTENMKIYRYNLGLEYLEGLRETARKNHTSVKNLCFAAYIYLMNILSNEEDIVVGNVSNNRPVIQDGDNIVGCFLNTVPVRLKIPYRKSWAYYIQAVEDKILKLRKYERMPLFEIAIIIGEKNKDKNPIFDTLFNFKDFHIYLRARSTNEKKTTTGREVFSIPRSEDTNTFFDFEIDITGEHLLIEPKYRPLALDHKTVEKSCIYFKRILDKFINDVDSIMSRNEILTEEEKKQLLNGFNDTAAPYSREKTMHQLFEEQEIRSPERIAVIDRDGILAWTYEELNKRANQLANSLRKRGVKPGSLTAVIMDRSIYMVAAVMGILKAGGAYVPLEPYLPDERIRKILESLHIAVLITNKEQLDKISRIIHTLPELSHIIVINQPENKELTSAKTIELFAGKELIGALELSREDNKNLKSRVKSEDISYIIFTSGSTGTPKGVVETHRPVINVIEWVNKTFGVGYPDKLLFVASLSFDLSVYDIFGILASGACLRVVGAEDIKDPGRLLDIIMDEGMTFWDSAPAALQQLVPFLHQVGQYPMPGRLRLVFLSGDWIPVIMPDVLRETFEGVQVISLGGATEATVWSNYYPIGKVDPSWPSIPYGKPIQNAKYYILDRNLEVCPLRVPGDLYIGGECLAKEYINDEALSAHKFIANPFVSEEKMYRTGDMARWFEDGNMQFLGRKDQQVKIRGYRIELGEIESQLRNHPKVSDGIVLDRMDSNGNKYLCSYYVSGSGEEIDREELKEYLGQELPEYMIPTYFIAIDKIPITANGKLDRKALPEPELHFMEKSYVGPESDLQEKLVDIWHEVLFGHKISEKKTPISIDDDFFELGGHSLSATIVIAKIHKMSNVKVPLAEMFRHSTIRELAEVIGKSNKEKYVGIKPVEKKEYYLLSSAQKRLYILQQMELESTAYNIPEIFHLAERERTNFEKIEETFIKLIIRHESLRTSFHMIDEVLVQKIHEYVSFEIEDLAKVFGPTFFQKGGLSEAMQSFIRPFDLSHAPLLRIGIINNLLLIDMHHIISDGISHQILIRDYQALYNEEKAQPMFLQYKDFSEWQNSENERENFKRQEEFWLKEFSGEIPVLELPIDYPRPLIQSFEGNSIKFGLPVEESQALNMVAQQQGATLFMILTAVFNILLAKLSGQEEIIVGTPIAGRRHVDLEKIIGMFVNTLSLRNRLIGEQTFKEFLNNVKERTLLAFENQEYPFEELVDNLSLPRDTGRNPLFDVMFVLQNMNIRLTGLANHKPEIAETNEYEDIFQISKFDLTLTAKEINQNLILIFEYCSKLFKKETIEQFIIYFKKIIASVVQKPYIKIKDIEIITEEERKRILFNFNDNEAEYPKNKNIHQLFEEQVLKTPDYISIVGESTVETLPAKSLHITYLQLNAQSAKLAGLLIEKGVRVDNVVGIMMNRSIELIIGILGIIKAGAAYLPIDSVYPEERKKYMLKDGRIRWLLVNHDIEDIAGEIIKNLDVIDLRKKVNFVKKNVHLEYAGSHSDLASLTSLIYVIYTSGSTGLPKGVMLEHRNLVNLLMFQFNDTNIDCSRILQFSTISFDASFHEIFSALLSGGQLFLINKETQTDISELFKLIARNSIKTVFLPISFLKMIFKEEEYLNLVPRCIRHIQTAGEQVIVSGNFRKYLKERNVYLHNHYGPSETHVVTTLTIDPKGEIPELPSIGKPVMNTKIYIVNKWGYLLPLGIAGEILIGGVQVGRGYLNRPELTAERFKRNVISNDNSLNPSNDYFYKTGDLARWLNDGSIEFLGRIDYQVKIRGFRIELGEIEKILLNHPGIKEAVVLMQDEEDKYLCAYIISEQEYGVSELREYLLRKLPDYMIPTYFINLRKIPLTISGKIDRKALPKPGLKVNESYTAPRNKLEKKLVELWSEVLGKNKLDSSHLLLSIGIDDNFFNLGGHSLKATILISKIHKALNVQVPLSEVFKNSTIRGLAEYIRSKVEETYESIQPVEKKEYYELSSAQRRLYFLQQIEPDNRIYNIQERILLEGEVDIALLEETIRKLIQRHESLRTSFEIVNDEIVQRVQDNVKFSIELLAKEAKSYFINSFDLSKAPLLRVGLLRFEEKKHILLVDMHHIISDGVSHAVLKEDFGVLYNGGSLPGIRLQYKDYSEWLHSEKQQQIVEQQKSYWLSELSGDIPVLHMPTDYPRPMVQSFEGNSLSFNLGHEETGLLNKLAQSEKVTLYMILLSIYNIFLYKLSNQEEIIIGTPTASRPHSDLERIIGMFVNTLVLKNYPIGEKTFVGFLQEVKEKTLKAFENQDYSFEELVEQLATKRDAARNPLFDVMFVLQNIEVKMEGTTHTKTEISGSSKLKMQPYDYNAAISKFDMTLTAAEGSQGIHFIFEYCTRLFKEETVQRMIGYFKKIIGTVTGMPHIQLCDIEIMSEEEKYRLLYEFNDTAAEYPRDKTIHGLFVEQVERTSDRIAVVGSTVEMLRVASLQITYRQLDEQSGQLARLLIEKGVLADSIVGIMMERSVEIMVGIFGILKAGGAYLPIDPDSPQERIDYMLKDSGAKLLSISNDQEGKKVLLESVIYDSNHLKGCPCRGLHHSNLLAYIIYTSGTTGKPKGVLIEHRNVVRLLFNDRFQFDFNEQDVWSLFHSYSFDFSVWEMYGALLYGGRLVMISRSMTLDPGEFLQVLKKQQVTVLNQTPSAFYNLMYEELKQCNQDLKIRYIIFGGEALQTGKLKEWQKIYPQILLINMFGITETTVHATYKEIGTAEIEAGISNIGKPIPTLSIYIMDEKQRLLPAGVSGELCIGGEGVARGYLNRAELTNQKFLEVQEPFFKKVPGPRRVYRSGDVARLISGGQLEYLGRIDQQVQIRGFRVELGEIESQLLKHEGIKTAVVIDRSNEEGEHYLYAYIVLHPLQPDTFLDTPTLQKYLARQLPGYMIPSYFVQVEDIPLTANGKVNRKALDAIGKQLTSGAYTAPQNELEKKIAEAWKEVLHLDKVSIHDNYFEVGGTSFDIIKINRKLKEMFQIDVPMVNMFRYTTIHTFAASLNRDSGDIHDRAAALERGKIDKRERFQRRKGIA